MAAWANYNVWVSGIGLVSATVTLDEALGALDTFKRTYPTHSVTVYDINTQEMVREYLPA